MNTTATDVKPGGPGREALPAWLRQRIASLNLWDVGTVIVLIGLTAVAVATLQSYAISNDEPVQHHYGELILDYYRSGFTNRALFSFKDLYLYGGLFDMLAVSLSHVLPVDAYELRHIICLVFGIGGLTAVAAVARLVGGARAGLFALIALASCGAWYGAMFNHTKDIPFGAAMAGATLMLIRCARALPSPRPWDVALFGVLTGLALGQRVLGLLIPIYLVFALLLYGPRPWPPFSRERIGFLAHAALAMLPALVIAYLIMIATWPYAAQAPLNPFRALFAFSDFRYTIRTLFEGQVYDMATVPRAYVPIYFLIRVPLATLVAATLALVLTLWPRRDRSPPRLPARDVTLIALTALFPILCEVISHGPAFTGLRHFTYALVPLAVLAGLGADALLTALARHHRALSHAALAAIAGLYVWYGSVLLRLHPYEYVYYNSLVGGLAGAAQRYDTDYWVNSMPEMVGDLESYLRHTEPAGPDRTPRPYTVAVCGERLSFDKTVTLPQLHWTDMPHWEKADFFIAPIQMHCDKILGGKVIGTVERMGVPIAYVKDRRALTRPAVAAAH